jgi:hypothetical protein
MFIAMSIAIITTKQSTECPLQPAQASGGPPAPASQSDINKKK